MRKIVLKDDNGKFAEVDLEKFFNHLNEFHKTGTSLHTQNGYSFTINNEFREKIKKLLK